MSEIPLYEPFIKSQRVSRNYLEDLVWCKCGHVTFNNRTDETFKLHRVEGTAIDLEYEKTFMTFHDTMYLLTGF